MRKIICFFGFFVLSSCARVEIKDHVFCADKGSLGAVCFHTLTNESNYYPAAEWNDRRFGQICTNDNSDNIGATFADWKATIEQLCALSKKCNYEVKEQMIESMGNLIDEVKKTTLDNK